MFIIVVQMLTMHTCPFSQQLLPILSWVEPEQICTFYSIFLFFIKFYSCRDSHAIHQVFCHMCHARMHRAGIWKWILGRIIQVELHKELLYQDFEFSLLSFPSLILSARNVFEILYLVIFYQKWSLNASCGVFGSILRIVCWQTLSSTTFCVTTCK